MKLWMIISLLTLTFSVMANEKVIYGNDDRLDIYQVNNQLYLDLAKSTAGHISKSALTLQGDEYKIVGRKLSDRGICRTAKFANQITAARCSGFLVGEDLLVTAGHCLKNSNDCSKYYWVFDFNVDSEGKENFFVPKSSVYECKEIVETVLNGGTKDDYALIRLDRAVRDREPLRVRRTGKVQDGTKLVVIGHPTGLPSKVANDAYVRRNDNSVYFQSNLDTFGGNSGSAVFNSETGEVEGILVRGERDYVYDYSQGCSVPKKCTNIGCRGEDVTRITNVRKLMEILK